ncbi:hypothetical protein N9Q27_01230 [bacterium]|nr:hypothetical protein [bacterium]
MSNTQKIDNTFSRAATELAKLEKAFAENGKLDAAVLESRGDTAVLAIVRENISKAIKALTTTTLTEGVLDGDDEDGFMARSQLYFLAQDSIKLHGAIDDRDNLEPWVQSKIAQASKDINAVGRYIEYNKTQEPEMEPQLPATVEPEMVPEAMDPASPELAKIFDNLRRGDKVKIKHDSALEKGTDYIEYVVKANNVLKNGVGKATLARADSPTSVKRVLYKRNGKVTMAIGDMAATLVDIQVDEGYTVLPPMDPKYIERDGLEGPFPTKSGKVVYYDPKEGSYYDPDTDMYISYDDWKALDEGTAYQSMNEAGGYYTQPVYDLIKEHGYEKVMHELLTALDANAIKDALGRMISGMEESVTTNEAGGYHTQPVYDLIEQHGIEKVMHELLTALDADVIKDALGRMISGMEESVNEGKYKSHAQRKAVHASKAEKANEAMSFDDKQDSDLKTIAGDMFSKAKKAAKNKVKK